MIQMVKETSKYPQNVNLIQTKWFKKVPCEPEVKYKYGNFCTKRCRNCNCTSTLPKSVNQWSKWARKLANILKKIIWCKQNDKQRFHSHLKPNTNMAIFALKGAVTVTALVHCWNQLSNDPNRRGKLQRHLKKSVSYGMNFWPWTFIAMNMQKFKEIKNWGFLLKIERDSGKKFKFQTTGQVPWKKCITKH